eukprot:3083116-Alexandrium_andersonii.AAC.1
MGPAKAATTCCRSRWAVALPSCEGQPARRSKQVAPKSELRPWPGPVSVPGRFGDLVPPGACTRHFGVVTRVQFLWFGTGLRPARDALVLPRAMVAPVTHTILAHMLPTPYPPGGPGEKA